MSRELKLAQIAAIYRKSLYHFCKYGLGMKDINIRTHGGVIRGLESQATRHLIVLPRGALKSSLAVTGYCIWRLIKNPNDRILIDSEVYENSKNFIREIKAYMQSQHLIDVFGDFKGEIWSEGEITIRQRNKPYKEASVTAGGVNTVKVGQHYSCIVSDDLNSGNNSGTPEARAKVLQHYRLNDAILDPGGTYVVIGTRYSDDDVIGNILKNEIGIK